MWFWADIRGKDFHLLSAADMANVVPLDSIQDILIKKLDALEARLGSIEDKTEKNSEKIELLSAGLVQRVVQLGTTDVNAVCGVVHARKDDLLGETAKRHADETEEIKQRRKVRQELGSSIFSAFLVAYAALLYTSHLGLLPVYQWELMKFSLISDVAEWLRNHMEVPLGCSAVYLVVIFGIQHWMQNRKAFDLRRMLAIWSLFLCIFSAIGSIRIVPVLFRMLSEHGVHHVLCADTRADWLEDNPAGTWTMMFVFSKIPELIDTLFIVLRKRQLITLHWYHHITVMIFCWHSWATWSFYGIVFSAMNLSVHTVMYFFYALTALSYRPTKYAMYITILQIMQMLVGTAVTVYAVHQTRFSESLTSSSFDPNPSDYYNGNKNGTCKVDSVNAVAGLLMYGSYLWLFCAFFYVAYLKPSRKKVSGKFGEKSD